MSVLLTPQRLGYRPEIDGLRAIAVLSVIIYHAGFGVLPYGFLGVDIFFVISGYLITNILLNDLKHHQFSLIQFYERRARRILPALTLVLIVTTVFAWFWLLPHELKRFGDSLFSTSLFHSNLYFAKESGYFAPASQELPLLHTWSLAVEEQFYFVFPVLLWAAYKYFKKLGAFLLALLLIASYGYFLLYALKSDATYFLPFTRAWELILGVACAVGLQNKPIPQPSIKQDIMPLLGLLLVYTAMTVKFKHNPYTLGMITMQACLGASILIYFGRSNGFIKHLLSAKWLVAIGLVSYSAYLWHYPILAFSRIKFSYQDNSDAGYLIIAVTLLLAWLSWKWIEQPFRNKHNFNRKQIYAYALVSIVGLSAVGMVLSQNDGLPDRPAMKQVKHYGLVAKQNLWIIKQCREHKVDLDLGGYVCLVGDTTKIPTGVIWGDSLAGSMMYGANHFLKTRKESFIAVISDGCTPVVGLNHPRHGCTVRRNIDIENYILNNKNLERVVWIGNFQDGINSNGTKVSYYSERMTDEKAIRSISETATKFLNSNKKVFLVTPPPVLPRDVPTFYMRQKISNSNQVLMIPKKIYLKKHPVIRHLIKQYKGTGITVIDSTKFMCDEEFCRTKGANDNLFYIDRNHFSHEISLLVANEIFNK